MKKYSMKNIDDIGFTNGVYVILDKKEKYNDLNRIVRVGSHEQDNKLLIRLHKHFKIGGKDDSILRKNIGRAILDFNNNDYIAVWNMNFKDKRNGDKYTHLRDIELEDRLEKFINLYMEERFEIVCFEVEDKKDRMRYEEGITSTIEMANEFRSSKKWLGNYSPMAIIRESHMWIKEGIIKQVLTKSELREVITLCVKTEEVAT